MQESTVVHEDIFELLGGLSPTAYKLFNVIKRNTSYKNNISCVPHEKSKFIHPTNRSRYLRELFDMSLLKKIPVSKSKTIGLSISKHTFMINPEIIQPPTEYYDSVQEIWNNV